jgi:hypothetical protein
MSQETNEISEQRSMDGSDASPIDEILERNESTTSVRNLAGVSNSEGELASITAQARDWFTKLSSEERSGATSFSDGAFLRTFLAFASPWLQRTNEAENHRISGSGGGRKGEYCFYVILYETLRVVLVVGHMTDVAPLEDILLRITCENFINLLMQSNALQRFCFSVNTWDTMVSIKEFETKYHELESSLKDTPKLANRKSSESCEVDELVVNPCVSVANDFSTSDGQTIVESDDFGIRNRVDSEAVANELPGKSQGSSVDNAPLLRRQIFDQMVLIFPSVFKNIAGTTEHTPHIVIRPSYFDYASDEEQFLAFTAHCGNQDSFLTFNFPSSGMNSSNWWRRISTNTDTSEEDPSAPLSSFLTARLEWAAWESFLEFEFKGNAPVEGLSSGTFTVDVLLLGDKDGRNHSRKHLLSILGDILSHCRAVNDLSLTIDSATLASFVSPLFDTCLQWDCDVDRSILNNFEDLILTPFSWILRAVEASSNVDLRDIDEALDLSLHRMDSAHSCDNGGGISDDVDDPKRTSDHASQPKKKKKNKKKKVGLVVVYRLLYRKFLNFCLDALQEIYQRPESKC